MESGACYTNCYVFNLFYMREFFYCFFITSFSQITVSVKFDTEFHSAIN